MKKGLKIAAITVGVIIILMFLLPFAFQGKIADIVKTEGNKMLNAQFDFKNLNISLFRNFPQASVTLEDFWLKGTGEFANDTLVQAGEVTAAVNLFSLFGDSGYDISKIFIEVADISIHLSLLIVINQIHVFDNKALQLDFERRRGFFFCRRFGCCYCIRFHDIPVGTSVRQDNGM